MESETLVGYDSLPDQLMDTSNVGGPGSQG